MELPEKFQSGYKHGDTESHIYTAWEESGFFNPDVCVEKGVTKADAETFSMVLPPPNVTGRLHIGHTMEHSLQDAIVRFKRMRGLRTLWVPGTDHAAIATQARFEKQLSKKKQSRHDFSREEFFKMVEEYALSNQKEILGQLKLLGDSLDWSRLSFTLDEKREKAVRTAFKQMYDAGLIYKKKRVINWDPKGQTTVSDDEVIHEEGKGMLYTFKYSVDVPIPVATTRLETKVGDTAIAVHPEDKRYKEYIGETFSVEFMGVPLELRVVADEEIDPEYGTGAVGVTPAHSMTDWRIAERHELPLKQVINEYGKMEGVGEKLDGVKTKDARIVIRDWLEENDLLIQEEEIDMNISTAERTGGVIEPLPKLQWFIDVEKEFEMGESHIKGIESGSTLTLKELMRKPVESGEIHMLPDQFKKVYFHWIDNLHDWCISRQIIFGHRIPVWYRDEEIYVGVEAPEGDGWSQDEDTLDTWFSSGLWSFSTLGWPEDTQDLADYHPTSLINPGHEILFFWIARMILMTGFLLGEIPFSTAYIHGVVRDKDGRKFSKSLDNGIDPEDVIKDHGTDAVRMAMLIGTTPGNDINFNLDDVRGYRKFANKVWNIARFIFMNLPEEYTHKSALELTDKHDKLIQEQDDLIAQVTENMENYQLHLAAEKVYHYIWHRFADEILEGSKDDLGDEKKKEKTLWVLVELFSRSLKLLHPFMPFVTEEIWQHMPSKNQEFLMVEHWPGE